MVQTGTRTTFNSTVGLQIDLADTMPFVTTPDDTPLYRRLRHAEPRFRAVKHEWSQDTLTASADALGAMYTAAGATIVVTDFTIFKKGYVIKIDSELMRVSATPSSTTVSVTTAYTGTTNANHANAATIEIVGYAVTDGADPEPFATTNRTTLFNYHQVFQEAITVSDLEQWVEHYGIDEAYDYEVQKWLKILAIRAEKTLIHGRRFEDSTNATRTMGGLLYFITTNATNVGGAITETALNDEFQDAFNSGGNPNLIVASPKQARKISAFVGASQKWANQGDLRSLTAGGSVKTYVSDFGEADIIIDRHLPADTVMLLDESTIRVIDGRGFYLETLAKTGTARKGEIVGWFTLEVKAEQYSSIMTGLT